MTNNIILAVAVWLFKTPPARSADRSGGWLARHESRTLRAAPGKHEPYVDMSPLDLTRRH